MVQSPSWETNWFAASQEIPRISRNPKVHYRTHKRPPQTPEQPSHMWVFLNKVFYREGLLAPRPTPKQEDHPSSTVRDCLFSLFAATLLIGGLSSIRKLREPTTYIPYKRSPSFGCLKGKSVLSIQSLTISKYKNFKSTFLKCNKISLYSALTSAEISISIGITEVPGSIPGATRFSE